MSVYEASHVKRSRRTLEQVAALDDAIIKAAAVEHPVTLRGVYYRVVSAGAVDKTEQAYQAVGRRLVELRRNGQVPFWWIADGSRVTHHYRGSRSVEDDLASVAQFYRRDLWQRQTNRAVILSEKDAISGVIKPVAEEWGVDLAVIRGYSSLTFTYELAEIAKQNTWAGHCTHMLQLGDHDPSGVDAWRSLQEQIRELAPEANIAFRRLAVTPEQIKELQLPTRPTKKSDTRAAKFAGDSVEVDAIPPRVLRAIVGEAIEALVDPDQLALERAVEAEERAGLRALANAGWRR